MMLGFVLLFPAIYAIMGEIQACDHCGLDDNPDLRRFLKGEDEVGRYVNLTVTFTPGRKPEIVVLDDTAPCVDVAGYTDRAGWSCWWWQGYDCTQIDDNYVRRYSSANEEVVIGKPKPGAAPRTSAKPRISNERYRF
eukprot:GEMP01119596.1.p1 GENE.GEMP01119596.1~~GEMP01119596.1.p1  ORF type:complete len:137 (+),score=19.52 GEMP01119596.1:101-511(+)